jgi:DNA-binding transcriptional ArsR family regulator
MIKKKRGFDCHLDLDRYENRWTQEEKNAHTKRGKFLNFFFFEISRLDYSDEQLHNTAIRSTGNKDKADEKILHSYRKKGWRYDDFPPIISADGKIKDGRTRIRAAILAGETHIPAARFVFDEDDNVDPYVASLTEGLIANDGLVNRPTTFDDLSESGVSAVKSGAILHEKTAIYDLVFNEFEAERFIPENEIPLLVEEIYERVDRGEDALVNPSRDEIISWLKKSPDVPNNVCYPGEPCLPNMSRLVVYAAPSNTNQARLWGMIARNIPEETLIVLYTTGKVPSKIKKGYDEFMKSIDDRYSECFEIVNRTAEKNGFKLSLEAPKNRPYKVLGIYPQLNLDETHKSCRRMHKLIKMEDY